MNLFLYFTSKPSNKTFFVVICVFYMSIIFTGCFKCDEYDYCSFNSEDREVFDMYKEGNWWVYHSTDGIKYDSIYIEHIDTSSTRTARERCTVYYEYTGELINQHFYSAENNAFLVTEGFNCENGSMTIWKGTSITLANPGNILVRLSFFRLNFEFTDTLNVHNNQFVDVEHIVEDTRSFELFYQKNVGIIAWINPESVDTFYLTKYFVQ